MDCQLKSLNDTFSPNSRVNDLYQTALNMVRPVKSCLIFLKRRISRLLGISKKAFHKQNVDHSPIYPGDMVRVLEKSEIQTLLNDWRKYKGCAFMDQMYNHCGKTYKVLKNIDHFYDEAKQKLVKCKDIVVLEKVTCNGKRTLYKAKCDRNCFLFWHVAWLEKLE